MAAPTADLEIHVTTKVDQSGTRLIYQLHSAKLGYTRYKIMSQRIRRRPEDYQARLHETIENLNQRLDADGAPLYPKEVDEELEILGHELYSELFPQKLQKAYRSFHDKVTVLLLVTDEPWIPWELVKPFEVCDGHVLVEDDFLCCQFELVRWLSGRVSAPDAINVTRIACIEAAQAPGAERLCQAEAEVKLLSDLAWPHLKFDHVLGTYNLVKDTLTKGGYGIVHFVGHGSLQDDAINASQFLLIDARSWRPRNLFLPGIVARIQKDRPLIFFNACQLGHEDYALTRLSGWASRCIEFGCGAFVAPLWSVGDNSSYLFAKAFYKTLERGGTIGQAARIARQVVRKKYPGSTAWLAYAVYGHPKGRICLGASPQHVFSGLSKITKRQLIVAARITMAIPILLVALWLTMLTGGEVNCSEAQIAYVVTHLATKDPDRWLEREIYISPDLKTSELIGQAVFRKAVFGDACACRWSSLNLDNQAQKDVTNEEQVCGFAIDLSRESLPLDLRLVIEGQTPRLFVVDLQP